MFFRKEKRKYRAICFDWDGTAVTNRNSDASELVKICSKLMSKNFIIYIVTGTNVHNIQNQFSNYIKNKENLYISANRGSEVFGYKWNIELIKYYSIAATPIQNQLLDKIVNFTKDDIELEADIDIEITSNRLNRRKLDLNPNWNDPPKEKIDELIISTENYLRENDYNSGILGGYRLLSDYAYNLGLYGAKITTDGKFLEIGLSDKSNAMEWIYYNLFLPMRIKPEEVLVIGDEFGQISRIDGSDFKMKIPQLKKAKYISVGVEPNGVPKGVELRRGNVNSFFNILSELI